MPGFRNPRLRSAWEMTLNLKAIIEGLSIQQQAGPAVPPAGGTNVPVVAGIAYDSRKVEPGALFVCIRGYKTDGHLYIEDALARGAAAIVVEQASAIPANPPVPFLLVPNARRALATLSRNAHGAPSRNLRLVGITGTNGKTTTTYMVRHILFHAGRPTGVIGTLGALIGDRPVPLDRTTPEAPELDRILAEMVAAGVQDCAMEVSSHAIALHRVRELEFDIGVFTNLTQDHLDFHKSLEDYRAAKMELFCDLPLHSRKAFTGIINADDPSAPWFLQATRGTAVTYGLSEGAQVRGFDPEARPAGVCYRCVLPEGEMALQLKVGGFFNVYNSLAAIAACRALGLAPEAIEAALNDFPGVPGRFEAVPSDKDFTVIVDYAHTPDGLENVLKSARALGPQRLVVIFGCGGDRDRGKRPKMGALAANLADRVIVTSDNPRSEDPEAIIAEILAGIPPDALAKVHTEPDRGAAIETAIADAKSGDLIVIAGKGHEDYQIFADRTIHFSDREVAEAALRRL